MLWVSGSAKLSVEYTGEIPGPILHCGRCHKLQTGALDDMLCSAARCFKEIGSSKNKKFRDFRRPFIFRDLGNHL